MESDGRSPKRIRREILGRGGDGRERRVVGDQPKMACITRFTDLKYSAFSRTIILAFAKRSFEEKDYKSPFLRKFILSVEDGNTVEAHLSAGIGNKFGNDFKEGGYYKISNFGVYRSYLLSRFTSLRIWIGFNAETTCILDKIMPPMKLYSFTDFDKVVDGSHYKYCEGVDLLGLVVKVEKLDIFHDPHLGRPPANYLRFTLRDVNGNELRCIAWGGLAYRFHVTWKHLRRKDMNLCALRLWSINKLFGGYTIHSIGGASEFWLNPRSAEASAAAKRFFMDPQAMKVDDEYERESSAH